MAFVNYWNWNGGDRALFNPRLPMRPRRKRTTTQGSSSRGVPIEDSSSFTKLKHNSALFLLRVSGGVEILLH